MTLVPRLMRFLSLVLPAGFNRSMNITFGALNTLTMILARRMAFLRSVRLELAATGGTPTEQAAGR